MIEGVQQVTFEDMLDSKTACPKLCQGSAFCRCFAYLQAADSRYPKDRDYLTPFAHELLKLIAFHLKGKGIVFPSISARKW